MRLFLRRQFGAGLLMRRLLGGEEVAPFLYSAGEFIPHCPRLVPFGYDANKAQAGFLALSFRLIPLGYGGGEVGGEAGDFCEQSFMLASGEHRMNALQPYWRPTCCV
jgi:hypothetical protein